VSFGFGGLGHGVSTGMSPGQRPFAEKFPLFYSRVLDSGNRMGEQGPE
jgi:hypothetical protein